MEDAYSLSASATSAGKAGGGRVYDHPIREQQPRTERLAKPVNYPYPLADTGGIEAQVLLPFVAFLNRLNISLRELIVSLIYASWLTDHSISDHIHETKKRLGGLSAIRDIYLAGMNSVITNDT